MISFTIPGAPRGKGRGAKRVSDEILIEAYERLGSVHKVGLSVGLNGSSVHERLVRLGAAKSKRVVTDAEKARITAHYLTAPPETFSIANLARDMGRTRQMVSRVARELGLTDRSRTAPVEARALIGAATRARLASGVHPRGFLGGAHTTAAREAISAKSLATWERARLTGTGLMSQQHRQDKSDRMTARMALQPPANPYSRTRGGRREDIGPMFFRSAWEANYARYLNWLISKGEIDGWEYEPETFWFEKIKRGVRSYKPDFRISEKGKTYFVEVKGWMDTKSKTKLQRMKRYHPTVEVRLVDERQYKAIARAVSRIIPGWETSAAPTPKAAA